MKRDTLARYFRQLVLAALPLAGGCCHDSPKDVTVSADQAADPDCSKICGDGYTGCSVLSVDDAANEAVVECEPRWCTPSGRRPSGLAAAAASPSASETGALFAQMAHLEAASVYAFVRLERELSAHGAPQRLISRARKAARDEARHARVTRRLARRFGATPARPRVPKPAPRPLVEMALENAVEGCVRETWGALVACHQAYASNDREVRAAMEGIAADEAAHAELARSIDRWVRPRLTADQRRGLDAQRRRAIVELFGEAREEPSLELQRTAGLPNRAQAVFLLGELHQNKKRG